MDEDKKTSSNIDIPESSSGELVNVPTIDTENEEDIEQEEEIVFTSVPTPSVSQPTLPVPQVLQGSNLSGLTSPSSQVVVPVTTTTGHFATMTSQPPTTFTIGGEQYYISTTKNVWKPLNQGVLFKKQDRSTLSKADLNVYFMKFIEQSKGTHLFKKLSFDVKDPEKLLHIESLQLNLRTFRMDLIRYDVHDVFWICTNPTNTATSTSPMQFKNLFEDYIVLSITEVADSNKWYRLYLDPSQYPWIDENLNWSRQYIEHHVEPALYRDIVNEFDSYNEIQRGGPLLFIMLMKRLTSDTTEGIKYLQDLVKNMKLTDFQGENVDEACNQISAAHKRLQQSQHLLTAAQMTTGSTTTTSTIATSTGPIFSNAIVPEDFPLQVISVFQTSSVPEFNDQFRQLYTIHDLGKHAIGTSIATPALPKVEEIILIARRKYNSLHQQDKWLGKLHNPSTFVSFAKMQKCFNCDQEGHSVDQCPVPLNEDRVKQNRKAFHNAKKKNKKANDKTPAANTPQQNSNSSNTNSNKPVPTGKFAPPSSNEKKKRVIDGKPMYWLTKNKRWIPDKFPHQDAPQANAAGTPAPATLPAVPGFVSQQVPQGASASLPASFSPEMRLTMANASRCLQEAVSQMENVPSSS